MIDNEDDGEDSYIDDRYIDYDDDDEDKQIDR